MSMIAWKDGLLQSPSGHAMRQVPAKYTWASTLWTSRGGEVWRRHYNSVSGQWHWDEDGALEPSMGSDGRMGFHLDNGFTPIETVIALAWLHRKPGTKAVVEVQEGKPVHAKYMDWKEAETMVEDGALGNEKWKKLRTVMPRIGVVPMPDGYEISDLGRLKNTQTGDMTAGFWYEGLSGPTRMAAVKGCGLIDLYLAAKLIPAALYLKPYLLMAANAMMQGKTPLDLAHAAGVQVDTAWSYFRQAGPVLPRSKLKEIGKAVVTRDLWRLLMAMWEQEDKRLGGKLTELLSIVEEELPSGSPFWRVDNRMGMLGFARLCVTAQA